MYRPFEAFQITGRVVSVIGSGGKTTLLRHLARSLPGKILLTTSTHIYPFTDIPLVETGPEPTPGGRVRALRELRAALAQSRVACMGCPLPTGKLAAPAVPLEDLLDDADTIIVEADGSAGRPLKAHRPWEPVIPAASTMTVGVVGASGLGQPAAVACHCPDLFCALAGTTPEEPVRAEHVARVLNRENLADCTLVNQIDALTDPDAARRLCDLIRGDAFPCALQRYK